MDFNKEEALRAKYLAEKKMEAGDFIMAKKIGERAVKIMPDLENISQLMTVCEVHISAQKKINGSEMDWYGILQIERTADEATIKKQFRKLALQLHPDKNKFAGAEAAFKLIGEANRLLTDQTKRSQYDMKCRPSVRPVAPKPPSYQSHNNSVTGATNSSSQAPSQFPGSFSRQWAPHMAFWTTCQFCHVRYQYFREYVNRVLRCQNCGKSFTAFDFGPQAVPPGSNQFPSQKQVPYQGSFTVPTARKTEGGRGSTTKENVGAETMGGGKKGVEIPKPEPEKPRTNAAGPCDLGTSKPTNKKKRKLEEESSESLETSDSNDSEDDKILQDNAGNTLGVNSGCSGERKPRRSVRHKQKVSYNENSSDDDFESSVPKRSKGSRPSGVNEEKMKGVDAGISKNDKFVGTSAYMDASNEEVGQKPGTPSVENKPKKTESVKHQAKAEATLDHDENEAQTDDSSELNSSDPNNLAGAVYPEPEFSDFDKDKAIGCFAVNQIWAIYDALDAMPRFYARVKRVFSPQNGFRLQIVWLESDPDNEDEKNWSEVLPVACGKYKLGKSEDTKRKLMFSHRMHCIGISGKTRGPFFIYPKVGETWALFRDWNINWCADPEKYKSPYQFEFVEVITDFSEDDGIGVAYLHKVKGFVSLFQRAEKGEVLEVKIPPGELFRFSHQIPSFRMTGNEREGVPVGSFELDPVSLPINLLGDTGDVKMEGQRLDAEVDGLCSKSQESEVKLMTGSEGIHIPKRHEKGSLDRETFMLRRSPRKSNGMHPNHSEIYGSQSRNDGDTNNEVRDSNHSQSKGCSTSSQVDKKCNILKEQEADNLTSDALRPRRSPRDLSNRCGQVNASQSLIGDADQFSSTNKYGIPNIIARAKGNASANQADDTIHARVMNKASNGVAQSLNISASVCSGSQITEGKSLDFKREKFEDKFQIDQIWALYVKDGPRMPKEYAQVKKIENTPDFRLHVALLEACTPAKDATRPLCCGIFKVKYGKTEVVSRSNFSHQIRAEHLGRGKFEIYPRKGEVWALYKKWNSESDCSDLGECEIVEVTEDNKQNTKVMVLTCINASKSLYKAPRSQRSKISIIDVPRNESGRFSHQIPAIQHTGEKDLLRGYWELDPAAVPGIIILD